MEQSEEIQVDHRQAVKEPFRLDDASDDSESPVSVVNMRTEAGENRDRNTGARSQSGSKHNAQRGLGWAYRPTWKDKKTGEMRESPN